MEKVIYLHHSIDDINLIRDKDEFENLLFNYFSSISKKVIIKFVNNIFDENLSDDSKLIFLNSTSNDNNIDVQLNSDNFNLSFIIEDTVKLKFTLEIKNNIDESLDIKILKYYLSTNAKNDTSNTININVPEIKCISFERRKYVPDFYNYDISIFNHILSYKIPILHYWDYDLDYFKDNDLFLLLPFNLFIMQHQLLKPIKAFKENKYIKEKLCNLT